MFFTKTARIIAWLGFLLGAFQVVTGFALAITDSDAALVSRYLGTRTTGEAIDRGVYMLLVSVALGTLSDIGRKVSASSPDRS